MQNDDIGMFAEQFNFVFSQKFITKFVNNQQGNLSFLIPKSSLSTYNTIVKLRSLSIVIYKRVGVIEGSILGPIMFLIEIIDNCAVENESQMKTKMLSEISQIFPLS